VKYMCVSLSLLGLSCLMPSTLSTALGQEKPKLDARETVEGYVHSALAGRLDEAAAFAVEGQSPSRRERIEEFRGMVGVKALKIASVVVSEKKGQAIAVSEAVKLTRANPDGRNTGALVFALVKLGDKWLVKDIDFRSVEAVKEMAKGFEKQMPDAKEIPARSAK
jgi:hypothetical protein